MINKKENCLNKILEELIDEIKDKNVALFFGTGLSKDSGNLLANEIVEAILCSLEHDGKKLVEEEVKSILIERTKQFEDFMNRIYDDVNHKNKKEIFSELFNILYGEINPNNNHYAISQLIKEGFIKKIYTTNFDFHLEEAYEELYNEELETCILRYSTNESAPYVKLHGCITKSDDIGTLLTNIASKENLEAIKPYIKELLVEGEHKAVLFMGYSFSDVYDIVKIINELSESNKKELKKIIIISHEQNKGKYEIYSNYDFDRYPYKLKRINDYNEYARESEPPKREIKFENFRITILRYNTNDFIRTLYNKLNLTCKAHENLSKDQSKNEINEWINELENYYRLLIGWRFNYETGQEYYIRYKDEKKAPLKSFKILEPFFRKDKKKITMLKALNKALDYCEIIKHNIPDKPKMHEILNEKHKAITLISMGKFVEATELLENLTFECEKISTHEMKNINKLWLIIDIIANKAYLYYYMILSGTYPKEELKNFINNIESYSKKFMADIEDKKDYTFIGIAYYRYLYLLASLKNYANLSDENDKDYFKATIEFYEKLGRVEYLAFVYMEYAKFLKNRKDDESYKFNKMAKELFENLGYTEYLRFCDTE